ncbi:fungal-specific transcription factor domain-containing protein [Tricladium varicosporioides]|nr:fungal-specific transcription factor domain-containing protein [Hymenoscyphus varicosporioides]
MRSHTTQVQASEDDCQGPENSGKGVKASGEEEGPACQPCRKKKAKCSRQQPCSNCMRFSIECVYDDRKVKPGLRTGAVENLTQRVATLENMFLGQGILWQQVFNCLNAVQTQTSTNGTSPQDAHVINEETLKECTTRLKSTLSSLPLNLGDTEAPLSSPLKRRRTSSTVHEELPPKPSRVNHDDGKELPPDDLIDALVEIYFTNIHPWIPILHVRQFRERMKDPTQRKKLETIFHAIVSLCARFSDDPRLASAEMRTQYSKKSRNTVILQSMESFSVENLQALVICAFDTIGSGRGPSAWSIVGSMTRTVEQLQLSVEDEDTSQSAEFLIKRMAFLPPAKSWIEREERRRVFWNVFLMDRFCSIATGWNFSLTSADVRRRLPCEGALWEEGKPLTTPTPYFGVADTSSGCTTLPTRRPELEDQASIGGFAYCIEASESLSLVTSFFLRHAVNVSNVREVQMWLVRFKELDLRLIQWKTFLPEQWREACALNADGVLDPNLTLAHITHNTAVGLLHQGIAYPSPEWQASPIRLPSVSSAETCMAAATEVAIIADEYLQDSKIPTNPQFAFCLFICGRMLLAHALHYNMAVPPELDSLMRSLKEISRRWNGPHAQGPGNRADNLASKFATRLEDARNQGPHTLDIRQAAYSEEQSHPSINNSIERRKELRSTNLSALSANSNPPQINGSLSHVVAHAQFTNTHQLDGGNMNIIEQEGSPDSISLAFPPLPLAFQPHCTGGNNTRIQSPVLSNAQLYPNNGETDYSGFGNLQESGTTAFSGTGNGYEDLSSFFDYSFLPTQRISMFSGRNNG